MSEHHRGLLHMEVTDVDAESLDIQGIENVLCAHTGQDIRFDDPDAFVAYLGKKAVLMELDTQLYGERPLESLIEAVAPFALAVMWVDCDTYMGNYKFVFSNATTVSQATKMRKGFLDRVRENVARCSKMTLNEPASL